MRLLTINQWWDALSSAHQVFWFIAIVFSVLFFIQLILLLIGLDSESPDGLDHSVDTSGTGHEFSALSVRSIIAFFTFFGWTGVLTMGNHLSVWLSVMLSCLAGLAAMFVVAWLMYKFAQLEQSGTLNLYHALDQTGEVYIPIPAHRAGRGRITLQIDGRAREMDAMTEGDQLRTGDPVRVIDIEPDNVLIVESVVEEMQEDHPDF